jgi:hypothetical protein
MLDAEGYNQDGGNGTAAFVAIVANDHARAKKGTQGF